MKNVKQENPMTDKGETPSGPAKCPACSATSNEQAETMCVPVDGACPITDAGFSGDTWPTQKQFNAKGETSALSVEQFFRERKLLGKYMTPEEQSWWEKWRAGIEDYAQAKPALSAAPLDRYAVNETHDGCVMELDVVGGWTPYHEANKQIADLCSKLSTAERERAQEKRDFQTATKLHIETDELLLKRAQTAEAELARVTKARAELEKQNQILAKNLGRP